MLLQLENEQILDTTFEFLNRLPPKFFLRLGFNLISTFILLRTIYFPKYRSRENIFTFYIFNVIIFLITFLLNKVELSMGAAFGLFAVFSMLRYRTENISTKDMTYLFLLIALGLLNAVSKGGWDELLFINLIILIATYLLESNIVLRKESSRIVMYEKIELIIPEKRAELIEDLEKRIGVKINHITIGKIDFLKDSAMIHAYYYE